MSLYEDLCSHDIIGRIPDRLWAPNGPYYIDADDGLIHQKRLISHKSPWLFVKPPKDMEDAKHFDTLFVFYGNDLGAPPIRCQGCWKVVVRPRTLAELLMLHGLMVRLAPQVYGCKCGIETRPRVNALYGGHFYNKSKTEGIKCLELVKKEVRDNIGELNVFLKRGCTEMEERFGDPDKWAVKEGQREKEKHILSKFHFSGLDAEQPEYVQHSVRRNWFDFAIKHKDNSCKEYADTEFYVEYKKY